MKEIYYQIKRVEQQESSDCVQAVASQLLSFYGIEKTVEEVKREVPVFVNADGIPLGTSIGHMAAYFVGLGFEVELQTSDIELFDQTWGDLNNDKLIKQIKLRQPHVKHTIYGSDAIAAVCEGFMLFLHQGGKITFPVVDEQYFYRLLEQGPIYAVLNYQFLFQKPKIFYNETTQELSANATTGMPHTHALLIVGYKDGQFCLLDPEGDEPERWVSVGRLVGAYYLADLNLDSVLIVLKKKIVL